MAAESQSPRVRFSLRWKITLPFMLLALILGLGAVFFITRILGQSEQVRFLRQLRDSGQQAVDEVVRIEENLLELERAIANTEGIPEAVALADAEELRARVLNLVINADVDAAVVLDRTGTSLLAARRSRPDAPLGDYLILRGESYYRDWPFVEAVLSLGEGTEADQDPIGNKQAGMARIMLGEEEQQTLFVAGPLLDDEGAIFGAVLVGEYIANVAEDLSKDARAEVSIYDPSGRLINTVFRPDETWDPSGLKLSGELIEAAQNPDSERQPYRTIKIAGQSYGEVLTPLTLRQGTVEVGILGVALLGSEDPDEAARFYQEQATRVIRLGALAMVLVVLTGLLISYAITRPLVDLAEASTEIASGNLDTRISTQGSDELGVLARTFSSIVEGLREQTVYRDLLGQTTTTRLRERLRESLKSGGVSLQGRKVNATVLIAGLADTESFTSADEPTEIIQSVNEMLDRIASIIGNHGGVLGKFDGSTFMAYFGVLPKLTPQAVSALQATHAALEILEAVDDLNIRRRSRGLPPLVMGIGISSGEVIAGGVGDQERIQFTLLGSTVETAQMVQDAAEELPGGGLLVSEATYHSLSSAQSQFEFGRLGRLQSAAGGDELRIYEVHDRYDRLVGGGER
jgi:class 3 adenylate cyclase